MSETQERSQTALRLGWTVADFMHEASEGRARRGSAAADAILEKFDVLVKSDKPTQEQIDYAQDEVKLTNGMVLRVNEQDPSTPFETPRIVSEYPLEPDQRALVRKMNGTSDDPPWWKFW